MNRLTQFILIATFLTCLTEARAMLNIDTGISGCQVYSAEDSAGGTADSAEGGNGKKPDKKKDGEEEEEEPDCD